MGKIDNSRQAVALARILIEKKTQDEILGEYPVNNKRHYLITTQKGLKYWMLYKRAFFMSFSKIFPNTDFKGPGDSINAEYLGKALNFDIHALIYVYSNGFVYRLNPKEVFDYGHRFGTIRTTKSGERTYSFPLSVEARWK